MHGFITSWITLFHKSLHCKSIVKQLSGSKLERSNTAWVECEYATRLKCDFTLELCCIFTCVHACAYFLLLPCCSCLLYLISLKHKRSQHCVLSTTCLYDSIKLSCSELPWWCVSSYLHWTWLPLHSSIFIKCAHGSAL